MRLTQCCFMANTPDNTFPFEDLKRAQEFKITETYQFDEFDVQEMFGRPGKVPYRDIILKDEWDGNGNILYYPNEDFQFSVPGWHHMTFFTLKPCGANSYVTKEFDVFVEGYAGLNEQQGNFKIYPNPTNNIIEVQFVNGMQASKIEVLDLQGKVLRSNSGPFQQITKVALNDFANGVYLISITSENGGVQQQRVILNK